MTWMIMAKFRDHDRPIPWSIGYPTKSSALAAKRRLAQNITSPTTKFTVEKED